MKLKSMLKMFPVGCYGTRTFMDSYGNLLVASDDSFSDIPKVEVSLYWQAAIAGGYMSL